MSVRLTLVLSDDLKEAINRAAKESKQSESEIFRKALTMYLAARDGIKRGNKIGLVDPDTQRLDTEFLGL